MLWVLRYWSRRWSAWIWAGAAVLVLASWVGASPPPAPPAWPYEQLADPVDYPAVQAIVFNSMAKALAYGIPVLIAVFAVLYLLRFLLGGLARRRW